MRTLVVFYSRTGTTRKVALALANQLGADVEEIREVGNHEGFRGFVRGIIESIRKRPTAIGPGPSPDGFDMVVVGTPIWAGHMASPVRAWLQEHTRELGKLATFSTSGGGGEQLNLIAEVSALVGRAPIASLALRQQDVVLDRHTEKLSSFAHHLEAQQEVVPAARP